MYLRECFVRNVGPIESLDLSIASSPSPKPLIIVGPNGSGKSILLSYVADALFELAEEAFADIIDAPDTNFRPYFRFVADSNQRSNTPYGVALLEFYEGQQRLAYAEKTGSVAPTDLSTAIGGRFQGVRELSTQNHYKRVTQNKKLIESIFTNGVYCYFPSNRGEVPHWLNEGVLPKRVPSGLEPRWAGNLDKPIYVSSANAENQQWLLDLFLDSMVDLEELYRTRPPDGSTPVDPSFEDEIGRRMYQAQGRRNIEGILGKILNDQGARLALNPRYSEGSRISVHLSNGTVVPSIRHMSSGESLLFNLFATITRYADRSNLNAGNELNKIEGIVVVDEVDAHLHVDLQYSVLPSLIKLFPRVQFILTSHAPMFLLGMGREFGAEGFLIVEAPSGRSVPVEEFSEFKTSFDRYAETRRFDYEVQKRVRVAANPVVLVEGQTDPIYLRAAMELVAPDLLTTVEIDWVGALKGNVSF